MSSNLLQQRKSGSGPGLVVPSEWNGEEISFPRELSVLEFFRKQVQTRAQAPAVKEGNRLMTYAELDLYSNRIANELRRCGLPLEHPVVILQRMSCEFIAAILGVLKAGGAYLPVATDTPKLRLRFMLEDSGSRFVLTDAAGRESLGEWPGSTMELGRIMSASNKEADQDSGVPSDPNRCAYIIYTSGSTGQPNGVEIEHHSLTNFICHYHRVLGVSAQERSSMLAYTSFDATVLDTWPTLSAGGCLVVPPLDILLNPDGLIAWLAAEEVTLTFVPTGVAEILFTRSWPEQTKLRWFTTGGDRLRVRPPAGLPFPVLNCYGPTENTVISTFSLVEPKGGQQQLPPIGRPLGNVKAYVLDEDLRPVPMGAPGELHLAGEQVARGYLNRPALTLERFVPDPFDSKPAGRMYRTGDWVRWLAEGELEFLGRRDDQIQIRGSRVELGEVDAALCSYEGVQQACCIPLLDDGMPAGLSAHIVRAHDRAGFLEGLRAHLQARLPSKAVPLEFVIHERLPLTPQGKLDRKALMLVAPAETTNIRPVDDLEKALLHLWRTLLPNAIFAEESATFQALGGDSLLFVKLMLGVEEIIGQRIEQSSFLFRPTFAGLCQLARERMSGDKFEPVIAFRKAGSRPPLFCLYGLSGDLNFHSDFAEALGSDQPVWGIRSPALGNMARLPVSIEAAAEEVRQWVRQIQPKGVPSLIGYSWGALLAFEVSRQLARAEGISCFTALVGSEAPAPALAMPFKIMRFVRYLPGWLWGMMKERGGRNPRWLRWRHMVHHAKQTFGDSPEKFAPLGPLPAWSSEPIPSHLLKIGTKYQPLGAGSLRLDCFRERALFAKLKKPHTHPLRGIEFTTLPNGGWDRWTEIQPRVHWVEGDHDTVIQPPQLAQLAKAVRKAMDEHAHIACQH